MYIYMYIYIYIAGPLYMKADDVLHEDHDTRMAIQAVADMIRSEKESSDTAGRGARDGGQGTGMEEDDDEAGASSEQSLYGPRGRNDPRMPRTTGGGAG